MLKNNQRHGEGVGCMGMCPLIQDRHGHCPSYAKHGVVKCSSLYLLETPIVCILGKGGGGGGGQPYSIINQNRFQNLTK